MDIKYGDFGFKYTDDELRKGFIDQIASFNDSPIDAAASEIIEIKRILYPVRLYWFSYTASWSATSIWEHQETYTEYKEKTVFVDNKTGIEYDKRNRIPSDHFCTPVVKHEPITKTRTVRDNTQRTSGDIGNSALNVLVPTTEKSELNNWLGNFSISEKAAEAVNYPQGITKAQIGGNDADTRQSAESILRNYASRQCSVEVPGNRHEGFSLDRLNILQSNMNVILLPVYRIMYKYDQKTYTAYFHGGNFSNAFFESRPVDKAYNDFIQEKNTQIKDNQKKLNKSGCNTGIMLILVWTVFAPLTAGFFGIFLGQIFEFSIALRVFSFIIVYVIAVVFIVRLCKKSKARWADLEKQRKFVENYKADASKNRRAVAEIMKNDQLSPEAKRAKIKELLGKVQ